MDANCIDTGECLHGICHADFTCTYSLDDTLCADDQVCNEDTGLCEIPDQATVISLPSTIAVQPDRNIAIPVTVEPSTGLTSLGFTLVFDPEVLQVRDQEKSGVKTDSPTTASVCNTVKLTNCTASTGFHIPDGYPQCDPEAGTVKVLIEADQPLAQECGNTGVLKFLMKVTGAVGQGSALRIRDVTVNGHVHGLQISQGKLQVSGKDIWTEEESGGCGACSLVPGQKVSTGQQMVDLFTFLLPLVCLAILRSRFRTKMEVFAASNSHNLSPGK